MEDNTNEKLGMVLGGLIIISTFFTVIFSQQQNTVSPSLPSADTQVSTQLDTPVNTPVVNNQTQGNNTTKTPTRTSQSQPAVDSVKKYAYKDGTYSAVGSYMSPGGFDNIAVTLTLKGDIVTNVYTTPQAGDGTSSRYQDMFISGYKPYVVGKDISSLVLGRISGSSLTPRGFNDALDKIRNQAKA